MVFRPVTLFVDEFYHSGYFGVVTVAECKLGKASKELDVDTKHYCSDFMCSHIMNEWRAIWLLRDGYQQVWTDGCERAHAYKEGP